MNAIRPSSLITLITDFGSADHYVGTMKGVIYSRCPEARLVDISHGIQAFSLYSAAYTVDQAAPFYPPGTIHVVVVDPGVGTARRPLLLECLGQFFVAPDNGVLSMIASRDQAARARELTNRELWLEKPSSTFHGRDIFAPVAAALASGRFAPKDVGPETGPIERLPDLEPSEIEPGLWKGAVLSVDHFGNLITNFHSSDFATLTSSGFKMLIGKGEITRWQQTFGSAPTGHCFAYFGSSGRVEIGSNRKSAAALIAGSPGDSITLRL